MRKQGETGRNTKSMIYMFILMFRNNVKHVETPKRVSLGTPFKKTPLLVGFFNACYKLKSIVGYDLINELKKACLMMEVCGRRIAQILSRLNLLYA